MNDDFENHCWRDVIPAEAIALYARRRRPTFVGPAAALIAIDLYESVYRGGDKPMAELIETHPTSCGSNAWAAIKPTQRLFSAARRAGLPIFYSTSESRLESAPSKVKPTRTPGSIHDPQKYEIRSEFKPQPGDVVITKQRASAFFGTPLVAHLNNLGVRSVIMCGESTSGCLRASAVDAFSYGYHVSLVEECCFDRVDISHKINLFDLHHKYCDVMHLEDVINHLAGLGARQAG
jgi:maleamate amidohydrolase